MPASGSDPGDIMEMEKDGWFAGMPAVQFGKSFMMD